MMDDRIQNPKSKIQNPVSIIYTKTPSIRCQVVSGWVKWLTKFIATLNYEITRDPSGLSRRRRGFALRMTGGCVILSHFILPAL